MSQQGLHSFDQIIKQKFDNHEQSVSADLWSKIESQRAGKTRSNKKKYLVLLVLFGVFSTASMMYYLIQLDNNTNTSLVSSVNETLENIQEQKELTEAFSESNLKSLELIQLETENSTSSHIVDSKEETNTAPKNSIDNTSTSANHSDISRNRQQTSLNTSLLSDAGQGTSMSAILAAANEKQIIGETNLVSLLSPNQHSTTGSDKKSRQVSLVIEKINPISLSIPTKTKAINCPNFNFTRKTKSLSFEVAAGPTLSFHKLSASQEYESYLNARRNTEQQLINYSLNLKIKKEWANNMTAAAGFNLTTFNYKYVFRDTVTKKEIVSIETIYSGEGDEIGVDTFIQVEYGIETQNNFNSHRLYSFPISLGYKFDIKQLFIEPYGGLTFNWQQLVAGDISSQYDLEPVSINTHNGEAVVYKTNLGMIYHIGLTVGYTINDKFSVILQPEFHKVLKPITDSRYPVVEQRDWLNINLGVKYNIWQKKVVKL